MAKRRKNQEKRNQQYESEKVNKVNNDEQQDDIKHLNNIGKKRLCV